MVKHVFIDDEMSVFGGENALRHRLFEGDNLNVLQHLMNNNETFDLIYIDPPYNTGRKLTYNDKRTAGGGDHQQWVEFMRPRLQLAHNLLDNNGTIWVHIGTSELAHLTLLMDKIFGEKNRAGLITRDLGHSNQNTKGVSLTADYILVYAKTNNYQLKKIPTLTPFNGKLKDEHYPTLGHHRLDIIARGSLKYSPSMARKVTLDGIDYYPCSTKDAPHRTPGWTWAIGVDRIKKEWGQGRIVAKNGVLYRKTYEINDNGNMRGRSCPPVWNQHTIPSHQLTTRAGKRDYEKIIGKDIKFSYPKPVDMISLILDVASKDNSRILDFFAGSGTTGQAVIEYNHTHPTSQRTVTLITNNENNIARTITQVRLSRVLTGKDWADKKEHPNLTDEQCLDYYACEE